MGSTEVVELYVYDMSKGVAKTVTAAVDAVYHTGVFVFGKEYSYGTKGIKESPPLSKRPNSDCPNKIENIGKTTRSLQELENYVKKLAKTTFRACDYNVLKHNCNIFSQTLCKFLCDASIPQYILHLQETTSKEIFYLKRYFSVDDQKLINMGSTEVVELYVYDMSKGVAKAVTVGNVEAVFHTGVFVFGKEYSYGTKGIKESPPIRERTKSEFPNRIEKIGKTSRSLQELENFVRELGKTTFRASDYHVLRHNCNIFSQTLCKFLCNVSIPQYILNLQETTSESIDNFIYNAFVKPVLPNCFGGPPEGMMLSSSSSKAISCSISTPKS